MKDMRVRSLGWGDPLDEEMATHSSVLAWEVPWTKEPGGLQSMGSQRARHDLATAHARTICQTQFGKLSGTYYPRCLYNLWGLSWSHPSQVKKLACLSFRPPLSSSKGKNSFPLLKPSLARCASLMKHILSHEHATIEESYPLPHCQLPENEATFCQRY